MINVDSLTKSYGTFTAVEQVSFTAAPGRVTGFLGPNGAGKSTTMRMMLGLTQPTSGSTRVLGRRFADLPNPGRQVGALIDASAQHSGRTGRETLDLARHTMGLPRSRVAEILDLVGLTDTESIRRVRDYSLGMRQRLGIAVALLGDPKVLILDEPANGLDPAGIRWMRHLLRGYANSGATVLLSSHLLHEIEVIADDLIVIGNGRIVAHGTKQELLATAGTMVTTRHPGTLSTALDNAGLDHSPAASPHQAGGVGDDVPVTLRVEAEPETVGHVAQRTGVALMELTHADSTGLEEMFLQLTAENSREGTHR